MTVRPDVASLDTPSIVRLGVVESTQAVAFSLAASGAPDGTVVVADTQSAGRGRRGRVWHDEPGTSLLVSILLRPRVAPARLPLLSLVSGVAVACALDRVADLDARLKWPNDVLAGGRKIAGILLESRAGDLESRAGDGESQVNGQPPSATVPRPSRVVAVGIGINVLPQRFTDDLEDRATSLAREAGRRIEREIVLDAVLAAVDAWRARFEAGDFASVRAEWLRRADTLGKRVTIDRVTGTAVDLDPDGALVLRDGDRVWRVTAGEID